MLTSFHSLLMHKGYLKGAIFMETEITECKKVISNKEKSQKYGKAEIEEFHQERMSSNATF